MHHLIKLLRGNSSKTWVLIVCAHEGKDGVCTCLKAYVGACGVCGLGSARPTTESASTRQLLAAVSFLFATLARDRIPRWRLSFMIT
jgi:hypothetical protein